MLALCALASACATLPSQHAEGLPQVAITPAQLQMDESLAQRLSLAARDGSRAAEHFDTLLEINANALRLAGFALGRRVLMLHWDGAHLDEQRAPELPPQVQSQRILRDVLFVFAPTHILQAALPQGWHVADANQHRELTHGKRLAARINYTATPRWRGTLVFDNLAEGYRLQIEAVQ